MISMVVSFGPCSLEIVKSTASIPGIGRSARRNCPALQGSWPWSDEEEAEKVAEERK
jgi:hypothetical protein